MTLAWGLLLAGMHVSAPAAAQEERDHPRPAGRSEARPAEVRPAEARPAEARPAPRSDVPALRADGPRPAGAAPGTARPTFDGRGQLLDQRYNHGLYYPPRGTVLSSLPSGYRPYFRGNDRYYFNAGVWYAPRGPGFVVVTPPAGLVISVLPPYYSTVWVDGIPYYYADNVYYTAQPDQAGYQVVNPPDDADQPSPPPDAPVNAQGDLIVYPKNGQSKDQQAADQYECNNWAKGQTGFDPTQPAGGVPDGDADRARNNYDRAMSACLQGRGYQVN